MKTETNSTSYFRYIIYFIVFFIIGGISINYLLLTFRNVDIPFFWAGVVGSIMGPIIVPVAIIVWILKTFNVI